VGLEASERRANLKGAFRVGDGHGQEILGRHVVLIDDVLTTGATAGAAANSLLEGGALRVDVVVFAVVAKPAVVHP
jgi:predicted amidophosphoribosyltransferase